MCHVSGFNIFQKKKKKNTLKFFFNKKELYPYSKFVSQIKREALSYPSELLKGCWLVNWLDVSHVVFFFGVRIIWEVFSKYILWVSFRFL